MQHRSGKIYCNRDSAKMRWHYPSKLWLKSQSNLWHHWWLFVFNSGSFRWNQNTLSMVCEGWSEGGFEWTTWGYEACIIQRIQGPLLHKPSQINRHTRTHTRASWVMNRGQWQCIENSLWHKNLTCIKGKDRGPVQLYQTSRVAGSIKQYINSISMPIDHGIWVHNGEKSKEKCTLVN